MVNLKHLSAIFGATLLKDFTKDEFVPAMYAILGMK